MGLQSGTDAIARRRVCLTRRSTSGPIVVVQPEMRSFQRTVRQLALQNLIEVKLPDHRTAASVTDRQSGEMNFCQKKKKNVSP